MVGGMCGRGACMAGGVHGRGACVVAGVCAMRAPRQILRLRHTVNERAVRILLECIVVNNKIRSYVPRDLNYPYELKEYCPIKRSV